VRFNCRHPLGWISDDITFEGVLVGFLKPVGAVEVYELSK